MSLRPLIVGNWKMNGTRASLSEARAIDRAAQRLAWADVALAPPFTLLYPVHAEVEHIRVGAQDLSTEECGAFTGEVSASMLADAGAQFVIIGHSERRSRHGEDDAALVAKCGRAVDAGLSVILCVGEPLDVRDAAEAEPYVLAQLDAVLPDMAATGPEIGEVVTVAYEPVWAIGTGRSASAPEISAMHRVIRDLLVRRYGEAGGRSVRILYGGSVNGTNAREILALPEVNGALVGGASLTSQSFMSIVLAAGADDAG
ncbi:triose-phosphate isomerase [Erythrobacteraceae bacterium CFH 75059]|uniref:triose-phosphate isomerase n=1 Tax=Qipengyuania thermophila TaxID=2509361 RepID=UPI00102151AF|nr:triose-phosphate isomerase [Qipengyuania thermophila]TCD05271.1 triose-phosphate isomerase [Erythrobacteraceae bacterium CFH 75059]